MGTHLQLAAVGTRRRRSHDEDQQQAQGATKKKKARLSTDDGGVLPSFLTEYTAEDIARFNQDMAQTDKLLDEAAGFLAKGVVPDHLLPSPPPLEPEEDSDKGAGGQTPPGRVRFDDDVTIEVLRSFATSSFHPISERFLCDPYLFDEAAADDIRRCDRFISKVYAWTRERAAEAVEEYDAKLNADRTIKLSEPSGPK